MNRRQRLGGPFIGSEGAEFYGIQIVIGGCTAAKMRNKQSPIGVDVEPLIAGKTSREMAVGIEIGQECCLIAQAISFPI